MRTKWKVRRDVGSVKEVEVGRQNERVGGRTQACKE